MKKQYGKPRNDIKMKNFIFRKTQIDNLYHMSRGIEEKYRRNRELERIYNLCLLFQKELHSYKNNYKNIEDVSEIDNILIDIDYYVKFRYHTESVLYKRY